MALEKRYHKKFFRFQLSDKAKRRTKKALKITFSVLFWVSFLALSLIVFLSIRSRPTGEVLSIGKYQLYSVVGKSMEPTIYKGSIIVVSHTKPEDLKVRDIITYLNPGDKKTVVTHRIAKINPGKELAFITRGDAHDRDDTDPLPADHVLGKVRMTIPLVGNLMYFAKTKLGIIVLVLIPGVLIILFELLNLRKYYKMSKKNKEELMRARLREELAKESSEGGGT